MPGADPTVPAPEPPPRARSFLGRALARARSWGRRDPQRPSRARLPLTVLVSAGLLTATSGVAAPAQLMVDGPASAGAAVAVHGRDLPARTHLWLTWDGDPQGMPDLDTDANGAFDLVLTIPAEAEPGDHVIAAATTPDGSSGAALVAATVSVEAIAAATGVPSGSPPPTLSPTRSPEPSPSSALTLSAIAVVDVGPTTATITWTVSAPATGQVDYGPTPAYGSSSVLEASLDYTTHVQALSGLEPATLYHFRVRSVDQSGNVAVSADQSFTTLAILAGTPGPGPTPTRTPRPATPPTPAPPPPTPAPPPPTPAPPPPTAPPSGNCTVTVASGGGVQAALDAMADGGRLCLSGSYDLGSRAVTVSDRHGITIDGRGATLTASGCNPSNGVIFIANSTNITVVNATLSGTNSAGGTTSAYHSGCEDQGGVMVYGGSNITVANVTVERTNGECFYVDRGGSRLGLGPWADGVVFRDSTCRNNGRMAVAIAGGSHVTIQRVTFSKIAISILDIEPYTADGGGTYVKLLDSTINGYGLTPTYTAWILETDAMNGYTSTIVHDVTIARNTINAGVTVSSNTITTAGLAIKVREERRQNISVLDNVSKVPGRGPAIYFEHVDGATVSGNVQPLTSGELCWVRDSTNVVCSS